MSAANTLAYTMTVFGLLSWVVRPYTSARAAENAEQRGEILHTTPAVEGRALSPLRSGAEVSAANAEPGAKGVCWSASLGFGPTDCLRMAYMPVASTMSKTPRCTEPSFFNSIASDCW